MFFCTDLSLFPEISLMFTESGTHNIFYESNTCRSIAFTKFIDRLLSYGEPTTHLILSDLKGT
jgi:Lrp/AsnC family leucine-responsive transcriptional regulator